MAENWKEAGLVLMRSAGQESNINLPNVLTLVRILLIPVFVMLLIDPTPDRALSAAIVFVVAAVTDLLDGYVARKTGQITKLGRLLDPIADKLLVRDSPPCSPKPSLKKREKCRTFSRRI